MTHLKDYFNHWKNEFASLEKREVLEALIELGNELPSFPDNEKIPENKVPGCVSGVFIKIIIKDNLLQISGHSDSLVVRGYVKLLCDGCSNITKDEFLQDAESIIQDFLKETNLSASLVASRADAFGNIVKFIKGKIISL